MVTLESTLLFIATTDLLHTITARDLLQNHTPSLSYYNPSNLQSQLNCIQMCSDPIGVTYDNPCRKCAHSKCKFEGCVVHSFTDLRWKPNDCTTCRCENGKRACIRDPCIGLECFGYPKRKRPGECCKECDFGSLDDGCNLVPVKWNEVYLRWDTRQTCNRILVHGCDKDFAWRFQKWYACETVVALVNINSQPGCKHLNFEYYDAVECREKPVKRGHYISKPKPKELCMPLQTTPRF